jgi:hypothetical protein
MTHHGPSQIGFSCPLRSLPPCGARSLPSIPPCSVLSASLRSALRLPFELPSLPPFGARLRFGGLSSPNWQQVALPVTRGQWRFAKSRCSPHLSPRHPQLAPPPSPVLPHAERAPQPPARPHHRLAGGVVALALAGIVGLGVLSSGARAADESGVSPALYLSTGALGAAAGDSALGLRIPYYDPPRCPTRQRPGSRSTRGRTSPTRSCSSRAGATTSSPRRTRCRRTCPCSRAPSWVSGAPPATRSPSHRPGRRPGSRGRPMWPSSVTTTCCTSPPNSGASRPPRCASATPSAAPWAAPISPRPTRSSASSRSAGRSTPVCSTMSMASPTWSGSPIRTPSRTRPPRRSTANC